MGGNTQVFVPSPIPPRVYMRREPDRKWSNWNLNQVLCCGCWAKCPPQFTSCKVIINMSIHLLLCLKGRVTGAGWGNTFTLRAPAATARSGPGWPQELGIPSMWVAETQESGPLSTTSQVHHQQVGLEVWNTWGLNHTFWYRILASQAET